MCEIGRSLLSLRPAVALGALSVLLRAQVSTASIQGAVRDSSGAGIPAAAIVLRNNFTNVETTSSTNATGDYAIVSILPRTYTLGVSKIGFQSAQQNDLTLSVNQTAAYDFTLLVGAAEQTITIIAAAPTIQGSTAELGAVISRASVRDLPLNGRNFTQLLQLTPGASPVNTAQTFGFRGLGVTNFPSFHGARNRANLFLVDGINNQVSITSNYAVPPIVDDIEEFKVDAHNDQVQFGGVSGVVVNVATKAGANSLHGAAWEYLRNSVFDARDPFFAMVNSLRQNQFGANGGGPVLLPHYDGRNQTFFFVSYEGFRNSTPSQTLGRVPTPSQLAGNLSDLGVAIYNPFSTRPDPSKPGQFLRDPFPAASVPQSLFRPRHVETDARAVPSPYRDGQSS